MFLPLCQRGLLVMKCWNSNITTGVNYSNLFRDLSEISRGGGGGVENRGGS
jgi:hypothetical protein